MHEINFQTNPEYNKVLDIPRKNLANNPKDLDKAIFIRCVIKARRKRFRKMLEEVDYQEFKKIKNAKLLFSLNYKQSSKNYIKEISKAIIERQFKPKP